MQKKNPLSAELETLLGAVTESGSGAVIGRLLFIDDDGIPYVTYEGNRSGPLPAITCIPLSQGGEVRELVLVFELNDGRRPIVIGKVLRPERLTVVGNDTQGLSKQVVLRGAKENEPLEFKSTKRIVLRCGEGSITITNEGVIVIKAARILSRAKRSNKIKGANVLIN